MPLEDPKDLLWREFLAFWEDLGDDEREASDVMFLIYAAATQGVWADN